MSLTEHEGILRETVRRRLTENELKPWQTLLACKAQVVSELGDGLITVFESPLGEVDKHGVEHITIARSFGFPTCGAVCARCSLACERTPRGHTATVVLLDHASSAYRVYCGAAVGTWCARVRRRYAAAVKPVQRLNERWKHCGVEKPSSLAIRAID